MDDDYIYEDDFEQIDQSSNPQPRQRRRTNNANDKNIIERAGQTVKDTGKTIKNVGKAEEKAGETIEKLSDAGENVSKGVEKGAQVVKKGAQAADTAGAGVRRTGEAVSAAGGVTQGVGAGVNTAGGAINAAGAAADATGVGAVAGVPLNVIGTATQAVGTGTQVAGGATQGVGAGIQGAGMGVQAGAKGVQAGASAAESAAKGAELSNKLGKKFGEGLKNLGKSTKETGEKIEETGEKIQKTGKDVKELTKPLTGTVSTIKKLPKYLLIASIIAAFLGISFYYNETVSPISETMERSKNYITGNGSLNDIFSNMFKSLNGEDNDEEEIYKEAKKWYEQSNGQIDLPLVFSALYYPDNNSSTNFDFSTDDDSDDSSIFEDIKEFLIPEYFKGSVRRVRKLCKNMLDGSNRVVSEEEYRKYIAKYIKKQPEYKDFIAGLSGEDLDNKVEYIIDQIYEQRQWYVGVFGDFKTANSEAYSDVCRGAIDSSLVNELALPVKTSSTITLDGSDAYGISNGVNHNGVDLTSSNSGVKEGDSVYSIAPGEIVSVEKQLVTSNNTSSSTTSTTASLDNFLFIGDSRYSGATKNKLSNLGNNITVYGVVSSNPGNWVNVTQNGSGTVLSTSVTLPSTVSGISVMLGVNSTSQTTQLKTDLENLHNRYPNANIYVNSVFHVGSAYKYGKLTALEMNNNIDKFNQTMKDYCNGQSWATYIDVTTGLYDENGYLKSDYCDSRGLHLKGDTAITLLVNNIKNAISSGTSKDESGGVTVKIKHTLLVNDVKYEFYSVLANLQTDSVVLDKGDKVEKEDVIGKVGVTNSGVTQLHFEFRNSSDSAIDPTNLFIKCIQNSGVLAGNTNEEKIWNYFLSIGYPKKGIAGIMGNMEAESSFYPDIIQGDSAHTNKSIEYTQKVDSGAISESDFVHRGPGGGGYGLAQWTYYTRKQALYNLKKEKNTSIGDLQMQLEYYDYELKNNFAGVYSVVNNATSVEQACAKVFHDYESPRDQSAANEASRNNRCNAIYNKYKDYVTPKYSTSGDSAMGAKLVEEALRHIGLKYVSGEEDLSKGVDCSGFMYAVYQKLGIDIPRTEQHQAKASNMTIIYDNSTHGQFNDSVLKTLQKGDLIFLSNSTSGPTDGKCYKNIGHVGMYIGNGEYVHAGSPVQTAKLQNNYGRIMQVSRWNGNKTYDSSKLGTRCLPGLSNCKCQDKTYKN